MGRSGKERSQRQLRIGENVRKLISEMLQREYFQSPWLENSNIITVSEVQVSPDLRNAYAYVMPLGGENAAEIVEALNDEKGLFNHYVAKNLQTKNTPKITFRIDHSFDFAERMHQFMTE